MEILDFISDKIDDGNILKIVISHPLNKNYKYKKIIADNKSTKSKFYFQFSNFQNEKVIHKNCYSLDEFQDVMKKIITAGYKQFDFIGYDRDFKILFNKKMKNKILYAKPKTDKISKAQNSHNREKNYIIKEGEAINWLVKLGIMSEDGKIINSMQKKYRQINRFLEFIKDIEHYIDENSLIIDFGCGKSYLTFATYYYFNKIKNKNVSIIGLDLKEDVIEYCKGLAEDFEFENLNFVKGDIKDYKTDKKIQMVIALHACDTATDYAIYNGIKWNAKIIMSVPCCQHELNRQIKNDLLEPLLKHGILKEKFSALLTDTIRAELLEMSGYRTKVLEFIDIEHTPKNIMIKAIRKDNMVSKNPSSLMNLINEFQVNPKLYDLLKDKL